MAPRDETPGAKKPAARKQEPPKPGATPVKKPARRPKAAAAPVADVRAEHVATRAYFLWQGGAEGDHAAHWFQAERELAKA